MEFLHHPFSLQLWHFRGSLFWNYFVLLRITDEGSVPEMRIWSILLIKSGVKGCIQLRRSIFLYCEGVLRFQKQAIWRWHHQDAWYSVKQHFCGYCWKCFPAVSWHSNNNKLLSTSNRQFSLRNKKIYSLFSRR